MSRPAEPLPRGLPPMLAVAGAMPDDDTRWAYELKWDGVRALVGVEPGRVSTWSRTGRDVTVSFPELAGLGALALPTVLLDGEIVALDEAGRPSFGRLQERLGRTRPADVVAAAGRVAVSFVVFDVVHLDGRSTRELRWDARRALLDSLALAGPHWQSPPALPGPGADVLAAARGAELEGVVAKRRDAPYQPGRRSGAWVKVKNVRTQEVLVVGWLPGQGRRAGRLGALLLALPTGAGLRYAGNVGTGFSERALSDLGARLTALATDVCPLPAGAVPATVARQARWVRPELVGEVAFTEWTADGRLRHPSWRGLRPDKSPVEVRPES